MKFTFFQFFTFAVLFLFMGMLIMVTVVAYSRDGSTPALSRAKVQEIRFEAVADK